jgi:hypothetical protein
MTPDYQADGVTLYHDDCLDVLPTLRAESFDACICDPPYPMIRRSYGMLTEAEWFDLMRAVVPEVRRVLKPRGSAVFVLQPNYQTPGRMRTWLWKFLAWVGEEWGVVQDVYWWNVNAVVPTAASLHGLMRSAVKACAWVGPADCRRRQEAVLWSESDDARRRRLAGRCGVHASPGGQVNDYARSGAAVVRRGGVTPFNVLPVAGTSEEESKQAGGHPGSTPLALCDWWCRYLVPPGGAVLDPFCGSGTTGVAALRQGKTFVGIEKQSEYVGVARKRLSEAHGPLFAPREETPA